MRSQIPRTIEEKYVVNFARGKAKYTDSKGIIGVLYPPRVYPYVYVYIYIATREAGTNRLKSRKVISA